MMRNLWNKLDNAVIDETKAPIEYAEIIRLMREHPDVFDISDVKEISKIISDERRHKPIVAKMMKKVERAMGLKGLGKTLDKFEKDVEKGIKEGILSVEKIE